MSHKTPHLQSTGEYFHLYNRGVNREPIFLIDWNYTNFITRLSRAVPGHGVKLLAYTLMPNHFHLLVRQDEPYGMSHFMKEVCDGYAKGFNVWQQRKGHVFESRYRIRKIADENDLVNVSVYIHRNPTKISSIRNPFDWPYGSSPEYCGLRQSAFLDSGIILDRAGGTRVYANIMGSPSSFALRN